MNIRSYADGISPGATLGIVQGTYLGDDPVKYDISTDIRIYNEIYTLFSDENEEELEKLFEREGFYGTEENDAT